MKRAPVVIVLALFVCRMESQAPSSAGSKLEFEVASVRAVQAQPGKVPIIGMRGGPGTSDPRHAIIENYPMYLLLLEAYHLNFFQLAGLSFSPDKYTINANLPEGATKEQFRQMLQNLLIERFQLKVHWETREMPIFQMSVAKNGPPLKPHSGPSVLPAPDKLTLEQERDKDGYPVPGPGEWAVHPAANNMTLWRFNLVNLSMPEFAQNLSSRLGRTIVDATGLGGKYDFVVSCWVDTTPPSTPSTPSTPGEAGATPSPPPSGHELVTQQLIGAIQKQLGLRLESKKGPVDMLVVDHFEKVPTEN